MQSGAAISVATGALTSAIDAQSETSLETSPTPRPRRVTQGPLEAGAPFGSRYRILRSLGAGGMGVVYQAWDDELGVAVALKVIRPEVTADPHVAREVERRFKRELLLARQVTHKNVVRIHDLGEVDGIKYITMPYVEGRDLADVLRESGALPVPRVLKIARQVAAGLQAAHEAGVIHRDLKPENIMIDADDQALIMDFGISRTTRNTSATMTQHGAIVGTLEYMAPEQGRGAAIDHRADIYAFGLMLHDMLAGRRRLDAVEGPVAEMMSRMQKAPPPLRTLVPSVPEPLERLVSKCVPPEADQRYATTAELVADLERLDDSGHLVVVKAPRVGTKTLAAAAALAGAIVVALIAWLWVGRSAPTPETPREPVSVLIADFDNQAGEAVFEGALEQALAIGLEGAPFISVYPSRDARALAKQLAAAGDARINRDVGRLISRREGIKVLVAGSIARDGGGYRLAVSAIEPEAGEEVAKAEQEVGSKAKVLEAMSRITDNIREQLGDAPASAAVPSETFTTTSLEAMQAYAQGQELFAAGRNEPAIQKYEEAIASDPGFGRAYSGIAVIYSNMRQDDRAREYYERALQHLDRMSEREKYRTLGGYYMRVVRNYDKAIESYQTLVRLYPADSAGQANLALAYVYVRNLKGAVDVGRKAVEIYPRNIPHRYNYAMYSLYAGDFETARKEGERILQANTAFEYGFLVLALARMAQGNEADARDSYARLAKLSAFGYSLGRLGEADLEMHFGRYRTALGILADGIESDRKNKRDADLAQKQLASAEAHLALGNMPAAAQAASAAASLSSHESVLYPAGRVLLASAREADALALASRLEGLLQSHTTSYARLLRAEAAANHRKFGDALDAGRDALARHDSWFARFVLGRIYLDAGRGAEALAELEAAVRRKGEAIDAFFADVPTFRYYPQALYYTSRAQQAVGARDGAEETLRRFLELRKTADPEDRLLKAATERGR